MSEDTSTAQAVEIKPIKVTPDAIHTIGRRKTSTARVWMIPGSGRIVINGLDSIEYLQRPTLQMVIMQPLELLKVADKYDFKVRVSGGGKAGQAGAVRLGISRALAKVDAAYHTELRRGPFLTRDPRMKERKKYGQRGARRRFQYSKR
ncbi:MAG: 30S ribosomal protein S9 [Candidatus Omnitrophica bacterium]|nr:30S ribosomal protein S9 [Candidatus Omnitrophota bacterium]